MEARYLRVTKTSFGMFRKKDQLHHAGILIIRLLCKRSGGSLPLLVMLIWNNGVMHKDTPFAAASYAISVNSLYLFPDSLCTLYKSQPQLPAKY